jgi:hypothetical protein
LILQIVTDGINDDFSDAEQRDSNWASVQTVARDGKCLYRSLSILQEHEGQVESEIIISVARILNHY